MQRPDDTGRALIETGIAVVLPFPAGVTRPELVWIEMVDRIGRNLFDCSPDGRFIPGVMYQRTMTTGDDHAGGAP